MPLTPVTVNTLRLVFKNELDRQQSINILNPVASPAELDIIAVMDKIIDDDVFLSNDGSSFTAKVKAEVVSRTVTPTYHA